VDTIDDMEDMIRRILSGEKMETFNYKNIKEKLSLLSISCQFRAVLENSGLYNGV
jgi:hypothetical protein